MTRVSRLMSSVLTATVIVSGIVLVARHSWFRGIVLAADPDASVLVGLQSTLVGVAWALCGLVVVWRTGNRVGWVLIGFGFCYGLQWIGWAIWSMVRTGETVNQGFRAVGAFLESGWFPAMVLGTVVLPLLFPTGRLPSRRSRVVALLATLALVVFLGHLLRHLAAGTYLESFDEEEVSVVFMFIPLLLGIVGAVGSLIGRFRRAGGVERQQIKWVVSAMALVGVAMFLQFFGTFHLLFGPTLGALAISACLGVVPVAITMSILRYRLYDIERIISRTVSYALVVAVLVGVFFGLILGVQALLPAENNLAVAVSTLVVAALFNPLRKRVQGLVDRRFNRSSYNGQAAIDSLSMRLRDAHDRDQITNEMLDVVNTTMQPSAVGVWLRDG